MNWNSIYKNKFAATFSTMGRAFEYRRAAKEKRWGKMSTVFPKLGKAITMAAKEGGMDPATNSALRTAIQNAKGQNMPKDNIEAAIKRAEGKDASQYVEINYEGKGPHGVLVFVECATDNTTRSVANVRSYFNKVDGTMVPSGSLEFMFNRKAVFEIEKKNGMDIEEMELELIDAGLEEITEVDGTIYVQGDFTDFGSLAAALEARKIEVTKSSLERFPTSPVEFTDEQMIQIEKLIDKLEDDDDVQAVYTNIAWPFSYTSICMIAFKALCFACFFSFSAQAQTDHSNWTDLLQKHVRVEGWVDYSGFVADSTQLNQYLTELSSFKPTNTWSQEEKLAYWINAYNAFTIKLIVDHFPVRSIKDIKRGIPFVNSVWGINFILIGDDKLSLNDIEHNILRKEFNEPRIHFAIVCASRSCPNLRNEAFVASKLEEQLQSQAIDFVNDPMKNKLGPDSIKISSIFQWFQADFTKNGDIRSFISQYSKQSINPKAKLRYLDYDWNLNGK